MKTATFENSVDVLVKAYLHGTLLHRWCSACAVGNLVASAIGDAPNVKSGHTFKNGSPVLWSDVFCTEDGAQEMDKDPDGEALEQIAATGYTIEELAKIEWAFESCGGEPPAPDFFLDNSVMMKFKSDDQWMFNGLLAVVDVLAEIHGVDLSVKQSAVKEFELIHASK